MFAISLLGLAIAAKISPPKGPPSENSKERQEREQREKVQRMYENHINKVLPK